MAGHTFSLTLKDEKILDVAVNNVKLANALINMGYSNTDVEGIVFVFTFCVICNSFYT